MMEQSGGVQIAQSALSSALRHSLLTPVDIFCPQVSNGQPESPEHHHEQNVI
jgi:hypothetical protein